MPADGDRPADGDDRPRGDAARDGDPGADGGPPWDLTRRIVSDMPTYPGDPDVALTPHATIEADGYRVTRATLGSHAGTHADAPAHTEPDGERIDAVPVERFRCDGVVVDLAGDLAPRDPIAPDDLPAPLPDADLLAIRTGWAEEWGDPRYRDHPYLAPATARRLAEAGVGVGLDCLSPDPTPSPADTAASRSSHEEPDGVPAHHALLGAGLPVVENLRGLGSVPDRVDLQAYPLSIADGDGAPVRAVAWPR